MEANKGVSSLKFLSNHSSESSTSEPSPRSTAIIAPTTTPATAPITKFLFMPVDEAAVGSLGVSTD